MKKPEKSKLKEFKKAVGVLKRGGIAVFPTDTVYGIGCRFDNQESLDRLYFIKGTPKTQSFPILVSNIKQVEYIAKITDFAKTLMDKYWPGGLTIVLENHKSQKKYGFRMPNNRLVLSIIDEVGVPVIGTSANFHGQQPPARFKEIDKKIIKFADFVIEGECKWNIESTVVDATVKPPKLLRKGAVKLSWI